MKDDIILPDEEIKASDWYQQALNDKNMVKVGFYDRNVATSRKAHTLTIVAGLSPGIDVDRDNVVEMTALFVSSQTGNLNKEYKDVYKRQVGRDPRVLVDRFWESGYLWTGEKPAE